ncbi:hypothetical protein [Paracoccus mutanolyticus]|nr:hypothetical protein [Paracoccus mutanolyticus]
MALSISPRCPAACHSPKLPVIVADRQRGRHGLGAQDLPVPGGP